MSRYGVLVFLASVAPVLSQVVSYEADSFPEDIGWLRSKVPFQAARWLDDGSLFQNPEIVDEGPPVFGEDDFYRFDLDQMAGVPSWFLEWVMATDGPEAFSAVAPASIVAGGQSGVLYHFTIADERLRLLRDVQLPFVFADIDARVPHRFRLEVYELELYIFFIDGHPIDSGVPEGRYPTGDSFIKFGARAAIEDNITRWDYIRFGLIPEAASGDFDTSGAVDARDFYFFAECLADGTPGASAGPGCVWADMDADDDVDFHDFRIFQLAFAANE